ncbi:MULTISPECIES: cell envelope protein SmpA [unclassified Pseudomonas]|uniref:cell envelope protein SmpA n=1 Tax=unclassified Pseudomonas TaxID=196821 RepID=UPI00091E03DD|nr:MULTISPECIES: cell envelope protein SmpA [unclassified Pseudomonas]SFY16106.1 hypothetical protein SAMN03159442_04441 [Pseudomonas sp. NFACC47-1]SFY39606.1 hypothetical protein SAMN03159352_04723 [Pseudomonas sp. NFACC43]
MPICRYLFLLFCLPLCASGQTVHRCEDAAGHITFTTLSCKPQESLSLQQIHSFTPGTSEPLLPETEHRSLPLPKTRRQEPTIVGQFEDSCANVISARQRREAIMNKRIVAGMSQQDVESALGKPDSIKIRNSTTRFTYKVKNGRGAEIVFDEKGCVKGKS